MNLTPVVMLKSVAHGGLGAVRTFGRLGVPVYTAEFDAWTPAFFSRYSSGKLRLDIETAPRQEALSSLLALGRRIGERSILIPSTDYAAIFIAENAAELRSWFLFPEQSPALIRALHSKKEMYFLARRFGVSTPATDFPQTRADAAEFAEHAQYPIMVKGIDGTRLCAHTGRKMIVANTPSELLRSFDELEDPERPNLMLQEFIPYQEGSRWMFDGYFNRRSECVAAFTGQKLRQCPSDTGYTSLGVCRSNTVIEETAHQWMKALGYRGLLDIDFLYDHRDGQYKVIDVNPRLGASFRLFVDANGIDLARVLYFDLTGQPLGPVSLQEGRRWVVGDLDLVSSLRNYRAGVLSLRSYLRSLRGIQETGFFALDDPLPFIMRLTGDVMEFGRRTLRKVVGLFMPKSPKKQEAIPFAKEQKQAA
jgi:predicted ATP-grasp superfamily ATP-dependent carboligase